MSASIHVDEPDVILIGAGIMSASLGALLKCLDPKIRIQVYELCDKVAQEASNGWNNAGTGHAGICELSYTPLPDVRGTVNVSKAIEIFEQFERSRQFWAYAVAQGLVGNPRKFIEPVPHLSIVHGAEQMAFLRARYSAMASHHFFSGMEYSADRKQIADWAPLLMAGRGSGEVAVTRLEDGSDVNFGSLAGELFGWITRQSGCAVATSHRVMDLNRRSSRWHLTIRDISTGEIRHNSANFVFIGAGGGSLPLLQKSGIPEGRGIGGFPIGGQWLVCDSPEVVKNHQAKVYGQAQPEAPTMAVPHLDTRVFDGKKSVLFGPFAAWTTKFLQRNGCFLDLPSSVNLSNLSTLIKIGASNLSLVRYLIQQGSQSMADRMDVLRLFYPEARESDWRLIDAGIRVQAIKKTDGEAGIVHYGTEVVTSRDRSLSTLLGASPGASVSVHIALEVLKTCFGHLLQNSDVYCRLKQMIPIFDVDIKLQENATYFGKIHQTAGEILRLCERSEMVKPDYEPKATVS